MSHHNPEHAEVHDHTHHIVPVSTYLKVFSALMVLLVLTLVAATKDFGIGNIVIAMIIAVLKAALIIVYFMHMKWSSPLIRLFGVGTLFWLGILFVLTSGDYLFRGPLVLPWQ